MPKRERDSRSDKLNKDLADLFAILDGEGIHRIKQVLADDTLTKTKLRELFPDEALRLAVGLTTPSNFEKIVKGETVASRAVIEEARDGVLEELGDISKHPVVVEHLDDLASARAEEKSPLNESLNVISRLSHAYTWFGTPDMLAPAVRVGFISPSGRLLLDSTLAADDVAFVAAAMVKIMTELMEGAVDLAKHKRLDSNGWGKLADRLRAMEENLVKSKEFLAACDVEVDRGSSSDSDAADAPKN